MKVLFDTNVYVAEALLGEAAQRIIAAVVAARWRVYVSRYLLDELANVLTSDLGFSRHLAMLSRQRIMRRSTLVDRTTSAQVPDDPDDSPILQAALGCGADYLVTNDRHLLTLDPYEGLRIILMADFHELLRHEGLIT